MLALGKQSSQANGSKEQKAAGGKNKEKKSIEQSEVDKIFAADEPDEESKTQVADVEEQNADEKINAQEKESLMRQR